MVTQLDYQIDYKNLFYILLQLKRVWKSIHKFLKQYTSVPKEVKHFKKV